MSWACGVLLGALSAHIPHAASVQESSMKWWKAPQQNSPAVLQEKWDEPSPPSPGSSSTSAGWMLDVTQKELLPSAGISRDQSRNISEGEAKSPCGEHGEMDTAAELFHSHPAC